MSKERILKQLSVVPLTAEELCNKTSYSKAMVYRYLSQLKIVGKVVTLPTTPSTYMALPDNSRSQLLISFQTEGGPLFSEALERLLTQYLELIILNEYNKEQVQRLHHFFMQSIGTLLSVLEAFDSPLSTLERPNKELINLYQELKTKGVKR